MSYPTIWNNFKRTWRHFSSKKRIYFFLLLVLMTLVSFMEAISISSVIPFIAVLSNPEKIYSHPTAQVFIKALGIGSPTELLFPFSVTFCLMILLSSILRMFLFWAQTNVALATSAEFSRSIYLRTLYQPYLIHVSRNSSEVISGVTSKSGSISGSLLTPGLTFLSTLLNALVIVLTLFIIDPLVSIIAFTGFGAYYVLISLVVKKMLIRNSQVISQESISMIKSLQEGLGGIRDVLIDGTQTTYGKIYSESLGKYNRSYASNQLITFSPRFLVEFMGISLICVIAYKLVLEGNGFEAAVPTLAALALGAQRLIPTMQNLFGSWTTMKGGQNSVDDGLNFIEQPYPVHAFQENPDPMSLKKAIYLEGLHFNYIQGSALVIRNLDLILEKGKRYGFVGTTGCGKSTLLDLVMGLLVPTSGRIRIDEEVLTESNYRAWQMNIAHVPQAIYLSDSTLAENIAFGLETSKIDMHRVREAAAKAQIAETIDSLPKKYDTFVGERGIRLSGGQRQRIGIARALYKNAQVIVFDEATSALDNETELAVMEGIEQLADDLTILIVAHRLSTLKRCDKIFRMDKGEVVEEGVYEKMVVG
jgi:ABC-type multidrug transport system fused ATPase/permease subunit